MITFEDVYKRYVTDKVPGKWVLQGASFTIPSRACVGLVGGPGTGKSTLLRLIAGFETPTSGRIECSGRVVSPLSFMRAFQPQLSGRQNAKFVCRINGYGDDIEERLRKIEELAGMGKVFEKPVATYTPVLKQSLSFALSMAFDFDTYLSDVYDFAGAAGFKDLHKAEEALERLTKKAGIIMVTKGAQGSAALKKYCQSGIWVHDGRAEWFDRIDDAIEAQLGSQALSQPKAAAAPPRQPVPEQNIRALEKIKTQTYLYRRLSEGLNGAPPSVSEELSVSLIQAASQINITLLTPPQIVERGYRIKEGMIPILRKVSSRLRGELTDLYDLNTQCVPLES